MIMQTPRDFTLPFLRKEQVAADAFAFYFDRTKENLDFIAGQYIRIMLPIEHPDERGTSRFFSLTTSPLQKEYIRIVTRIGKSSFKQEFANLIPGTMVRFFGPVGRFTLDEENPQVLVFLAGGIGITPFLSIAAYVIEEKLPFHITLLASFSTTKDLIYYKELIDLTKGSSIKVIYTVTQPEESKTKWEGETGRVSKEMIEKYVPDTKNAVYYIAGPPAMVDAMVTMVEEMGIMKDAIRKESFTGY